MRSAPCRSDAVCSVWPKQLPASTPARSQTTCAWPEPAERRDDRRAVLERHREDAGVRGPLGVGRQRAEVRALAHGDGRDTMGPGPVDREVDGVAAGHLAETQAAVEDDRRSVVTY